MHGRIGPDVDLAFMAEQVVLGGDGTQHRIRLHQPDLGGDELVGVVQHGARGFSTDDALRRLAVDVNGDGGFVDRRQALTEEIGGRHDEGDEGEHAPTMAAQDP